MKVFNAVKKLKYEILVFVFFLVSRLPKLGFDFFNTDVWKWKSRTYDFSTGVFTFDFAKTIQKYHPGVTLMWLGTFAVKFYNFFSRVLSPGKSLDTIQAVFELHFVQKFLIVCVIGVTLAFCFYVLRKLFGSRYALITVFLLSVEPFYVALTRVVHLEGLMSTFMLASFLWFYYFLHEPPKTKRLIISGIFSALAILTKTSSLFMLPFVGLLSVVWYLKDNQKFKKAVLLSLGHYWKWLLVVLLGFVLLWPAMWVAPLEVLSVLYKGIFSIGVEGGHEQLYFGYLVDDPGPFFYFVVLGLRSSVYLLAGLVGYLVIFKKVGADRRKFAFFVLLFSGLYFLQSTLPSKKLDRYILPAMLGFVLITGVFYTWLSEKLNKFFVLLLIPPIVVLAYVHPDYFSYFNPIFGGLRVGITILEPKWVIGQHEIVKYFQKVKSAEGLEDLRDDENFEELDQDVLNKKLVVAIQEKYYAQLWPFIEKIGGRPVVKDLTPHAQKANYFIYPVWDDDSSADVRFKLEFVGTIDLRGVPLWRVYKRIPLP